MAAAATEPILILASYPTLTPTSVPKIVSNSAPTRAPAFARTASTTCRRMRWLLPPWRLPPLPRREANAYGEPSDLFLRPLDVGRIAL